MRIRLRFLLPPVVCFALAGCGMFGSTAPAVPDVTPGPVTAFMINNEPGASVTLDDPEFGTEIHVALQDTFTSAAGEQCKRATLVAREREAEIVVICRDAAGRWNMAPRIWGQGIH